jgi:predicted transcriptional regulator
MARPLVGQPKRHVTLTLDPKQLKDVDRLAKKLRISRSEATREAYALWLEWQRQEAEIDRNLAKICAERDADPDAEVVPYEEARARLRLA